MFGPLGLPEVLLILVLALLIFGPKRLPEVGRTIGKGLSEFRRASSDLKRTVNAELALDEDERPPTSRRPDGGSRAGGSRKPRLASAPAEPPPGAVASEPGPATPEPGDAGGRTPDVPPAASPSGEGASGKSPSGKSPSGKGGSGEGATGSEESAGSADNPAAEAEGSPAERDEPAKAQ